MDAQEQRLVRERNEAADAVKNARGLLNKVAAVARLSEADRKLRDYRKKKGKS